MDVEDLCRNTHKHNLIGNYAPVHIQALFFMHVILLNAESSEYSAFVDIFR